MRYRLIMYLKDGDKTLEKSLEYDEQPPIPSIGDSVLFITDGSSLGVVRERCFKYGPDSQLCVVDLRCVRPN